MRWTIERAEEVTSTNTVLKQMAAAGAPEGTVLIAARQTGGRGRLGRTFFSPDGGLYMSVLLRRAARTDDRALLTVAAATAAAEAAEALCGRPVGIKWVNDLMLDGRKVCGILAESVTDPGSGDCCAVVGFGVNVAPPPGGFPPEVRDIAGTLLPAPQEGVADRLAMQILERFGVFADALAAREYLPGYRARQVLVGQRVTFFEQSAARQADVLGVTDDGGLRVRLPNGGKRVLTAGEVTLHRDI